MPNRNGTGPLGSGPMTGRGLGSCGAGIGRSGFGFGQGRGYGKGFFGCRRGVGGFFGPGAGYVDESELLKQEKNILQSRLDQISKQIDEMNGEKK